MKNELDHPLAAQFNRPELSVYCQYYPFCLPVVKRFIQMERKFIIMPVLPLFSFPRRLGIFTFPSLQDYGGFRGISGPPSDIMPVSQFLKRSSNLFGPAAGFALELPHWRYGTKMLAVKIHNTQDLAGIIGQHVSWLPDARREYSLPGRRGVRLWPDMLPGCGRPEHA
ncbi:hypothetical protein D3C81_107070 [compost metagenome]